MLETHENTLKQTNGQDTRIGTQIDTTKLAEKEVN